MRVRMHYQGRVQGVGFRATARQIAERRRVAGWVRNEPDGSVLLEVQGPSDEVEAFLDSLAAAMAGRITTAGRATLSEQGGEQGFRIDR